MITMETLARELAALRQIEEFCVVRALVRKCPALWTFDYHAGMLARSVEVRAR
jgi:hypothetical protein